MEDVIECGEFVFIRDFDSGNLGHVEQVPKEEIGVNFKTSAPETADYEFNVWTRPDCFGTEFENGNRTWFFFGIRSAPAGVLVKLNLVNLNKQGKMYSQGMAPVMRTVPGRPNWERIKDKPAYFCDDNIFTLSFKFRTPENTMATTYFAFTYPYSYNELQNSLEAIDKKFPEVDSGNDDDIYYCRECVCYSLEKRRVDLLTITSRHGITNQREETLKNLFPEGKERPFKFSNKKVVFISARVHPGETPSSFVFNGFLNLILNRNDPVAIALRKLYVFKMIPFMNPDGVYKGHYRTDTRGVNLNRMYQTPSFELHPSVYAARALIRYHHFGCEKHDSVYDLTDDGVEHDFHLGKQERIDEKLSQVEELNLNQSSVDGFNINECANDSIVDTSIPMVTKPSLPDDLSIDDTHLTFDDDDDDNDVVQGTSPLRQLQSTLQDNINLILKDRVETSEQGFTQPWCNNCKTTVEELEPRMPGISQMLPSIYKNEIPSNISITKDENVICINCRSPISNDGNEKQSVINNNISAESDNVLINPHLNSESSKDLNKNDLKNKINDKRNVGKKSKSFSVYGRGLQKEKESNLFLYIDLHGHASKKGIFMYGNHFEDIENSVECMLLPRIMSLNNLHFHFTSCNFTERNMYLRDRRDGMSREGSGRVAVLKATGLMRSYTLECNYNTGRLVNVLPPTLKEAAPPGPPPITPTLTPPKYTPHLFEEVGKSLGSSILDLTSHHPNSRIPASEHRNLPGIRDWLRQHSRHIKPSQIISARQSTSACTPRASISRSVRSLTRPSKTQNFMDPERKENLAAPGYPTDSRISSSRVAISSGSRSTSSGLKLLPIRLRGEQTLSAKAQRNLSLISIKKSSSSKLPPSFKTPSRNRSPGPKLRFNAKQKIAEDNDLVKGTIRSLMESNRSNTSKQVFKTKNHKTNFKGHKDNNVQKPNPEVPTTSLTHRKAKTRSKESLFQKQPGQFTAKPLSKRLKMSQYIKYSDNCKEKYRICKNVSGKKVGEVEGTSSPVSSSGEDVVLSWNSLRVQKVANSNPGTSSNSQSVVKCPQRTPFKSRRPALHHIPTTTPDLGTIRNKFL
ncbi:cytosolic carboxypeptidase-like protein 5 isoform X3 [Arctopsyche grandis]|uniref:cytosolic carboxypeptidase-like protein 5 isoform X3 n=1 Tax=Arctopsyche grandis TaxID=121162 RepID=UPI00406DA2EE